jgi:hypothetical protein
MFSKPLAGSVILEPKPRSASPRAYAAERDILAMSSSRRAALFALPLLTALVAPPYAAAQARASIVGTWELLSLYDENDGDEVDVFGPNPMGRLTLDKAGFFSFVLLTSTPLISPRADRSTAPMTKDVVGPGTLAYYGTYTIDETRTIRFRIMHGLTDGWKNAVREAQVDFVGDSMSLVSSFGSLTGSDYSRLTWRRLCD